MNSFGLGLILNFTDNASSGMLNATRTFQQMSATADSMASSVSTSISSIVAASYALDSVGSTMLNAGSSILNLYGNVTQSIIDSGMQMQGYRMQLSALYGGIEAGEQKIQEIKDYAMTSVFDIQSLIPAVTTMKAVGIEAMEEVTTSSGQHTQKLLDYASDIAAMVPNMRNTYGTGVQAAMGALKEYIAEGNALSLKRGAGLDIDGILGEAKGSTIEERTRQIADLVEKLNIVGFTTKLSETPTQRLSNMQDALFKSLTKIADSGVFEKYCDLLEKLSNWVFSLVNNEETFNTITGVLADTVTSLLSPIESLLDLVIKNGDALVDWISEHPKLAKNILLTVAAIGGFLTVGGLFLKLISSIGMASAGFEFLKGLPTILSTVGTGFKTLALKALPFLALAGLAYYAWSENLFGIRDTITGVVEDLSSIFSLVSDAWDDNTLTQENYDLANSLGILPLIESLLQLKYYWGFFVDGFKVGFDEFFHSLEDTLGTFGIDIVPIFESIGEFLKSLVDIGQEDKWASIGKVVGKLAGIAISLFAIFKVLSLFKPLVTLFKGGLPLLGGGKSKSPLAGGSKPFDGIINVFTNLAKANPTTVLKGMLNLGIIIGGLTIIAAAVMAVSPYLSELTDMKSFLTVVAGIVVLGVVGTALASLSQIVGKIQVSTVAKGLANMAIMIGGLSALLIVVGAVSAIPFNKSKMLDTIVVIGILGLMGTALSVLGGIVGLIPVTTVALGLANMAIIIGGLSALYVVIGELTQLGFQSSELTEVITIVGVLGLLGTALTALAAIIGLVPIPVVLTGIANIILVVGALTGLAVAISEALPKIGENISDFATSIKPAFDIFASLNGVDFKGIGGFFTSFGGFMLQLAGDKIVSFFTGNTDLTKVGNQLVAFATVSKEAFILFSEIPSGSMDSVLSTIDTLETLAGSKMSSLVENKILSSMGNEFSNFADSLRKSFTDFPDINTGIITTLETCTAESLQIMNSFANKGYSIGSNLMGAIASSISSSSHLVTNALQKSLGSMQVSTPAVTVQTHARQNMVGLSTGGYVKETGIAVLHPNEVVVNDDLTQELRAFLSHQHEAYSSGSSNSNFNSNRGEVKNDYSVTFSAGSIVIQLANATDAELEKAAEKLMKIIERKQQLKAMAVRA